MRQDIIFSEGEGDAWFERNRGFYQQERDPVLNFLSSQPIEPRAILEIGASRGDRLAVLRNRYHAAVTAVEPSSEAVADGRNHFPEIEFFIATAKLLPLPDEGFDFVIVNFVFHWIDRKSLLSSAAEIDRVLKPNGHLLIGDFAPFSPKKSRYHHRPDLEMYTYKQDYPALFLTTAGYRLLAQQVLDHRTLKPSAEIPERERFSITLLQKVPGGVYGTESGDF
jgi:ubiquinone/menaquinone biosynthesis C-methylase UbiE